jgi:uncharacterized membrane protein
MSISSLPRATWRVPAGLMLLGVVPLLGGLARLGDLAGHAAITPANARFHAAPLPIVLHIVSALPFSLLGALQFATGFRQLHPGWHRAAGRVLVVCGLVAAIAGLYMTMSYPWPAGDGVALYSERLLAGTWMTLALVRAVVAIRRRDIRRHRAWMIRGYAIGMGAGTQVLTHLPFFVLVGQPGETARAVLMGAGWAINFFVAEWILRRRTGARPAVPALDHVLLEA